MANYTQWKELQFMATSGEVVNWNMMRQLEILVEQRDGNMLVHELIYDAADGLMCRGMVARTSGQGI